MRCQTLDSPNKSSSIRPGHSYCRCTIKASKVRKQQKDKWILVILIPLLLVTPEEMVMLKEIKGLNIDWEKLKPKKQEDIDKRSEEYTETKKYNVGYRSEEYISVVPPFMPFLRPPSFRTTANITATS